jgi:hypothetical protein
MRSTPARMELKYCRSTPMMIGAEAKLALMGLAPNLLAQFLPQFVSVVPHNFGFNLVGAELKVRFPK